MGMIIKCECCPSLAVTARATVHMSATKLFLKWCGELCNCDSQGLSTACITKPAAEQISEKLTSPRSVLLLEHFLFTAR